MKKLRVLGICGSLRKESYNMKLLKLALRFAGEAGADTAIADLNELNLPFYNYDIHLLGFPEGAEKLIMEVQKSDVFLFASPEYNYSISGALKNAIDWVSRKVLNPFDGKTAALFGASTGPMGTIRGQFQLRQILTAVNLTTLPQPQVFVTMAESAFDKDGFLNNKTIEDQLRQLVNKTLSLSGKTQ